MLPTFGKSDPISVTPRLPASQRSIAVPSIEKRAQLKGPNGLCTRLRASSVAMPISFAVRLFAVSESPTVTGKMSTPTDAVRNQIKEKHLKSSPRSHAAVTQ